MIRAPLARRSLAVLAGFGLLLPAKAFDLIGSSWANGDIVIHLQLGPAPSALLDGAADWNSVAEAALNDWNQHLTRSRFVVVRDSTAGVAEGNRVNNVAFRADVYGTAFDSRTLAVTVGRSNALTGRSTEKDVLFNSNRTWNSYRGPLRSGLSELRRVALHEFGHVLGLDHPDKATPVQNVDAIMNSTISSAVETLRDDDIAGARALYNTSSGVAPVIAAHPQSRTVQVGESYTMEVSVSGSGPFTYAWTFQPAGSATAERFAFASGPSYTIGSVQQVDAGTYRVTVNSPGGIVSSNAASLSVTPLATAGDTLLANISTRGVVGTGDDVLIAGLAIGGTTPKNVLVRAAGPSLGQFSVGGALGDPTLTLVNARGEVVAENDNWETSGAGSSAIANASARVGAFAFTAGSRDAALLTTLAPGTYTAIVRGANASTGVALVEAYDADADAATSRSRRLVNIATRGQVISGANILIAGLVVTGPGPRTYLIRAIGPTLARPPFNISSALLDPFLQIYQGDTLLRENDDWDTPSSAQSALRTVAQQVGAFALVETRDQTQRSGLDAAMLITLQPGSYTAKVSGFNGATGVGLIEIYEVPQ